MSDDQAMQAAMTAFKSADERLANLWVRLDALDKDKAELLSHLSALERDEETAAQAFADTGDEAKLLEAEQALAGNTAKLKGLDTRIDAMERAIQGQMDEVETAHRQVEDALQVYWRAREVELVEAAKEVALDPLLRAYAAWMSQPKSLGIGGFDDYVSRRVIKDMWGPRGVVSIVPDGSAVPTSVPPSRNVRRWNARFRMEAA